MVVWHPDFVDGNRQPQQLRMVKKYWEVETEGSLEYFFDEVEENTTAATELSAPLTLLEAIDTEVVGMNDGGANILLNALNRVMDIDDDNPAPENNPSPTQMAQLCFQLDVDGSGNDVNLEHFQYVCTAMKFCF